MPSSAPPSPERVSPAVHVALFVVQLAFGSLAVEGKLAMGPGHGVSPPALAMARLLGGAVTFAVAHLVLGTPRIRKLRDAGELVILAPFGVVLNQALFLAGLSRTSPVAATLLVATIPVFTAALSAVSGRAKLTLRGVAGIGLSLFGVGVLTGFALPRAGDALVLLNAASYAVYVVFSRSALARHGTGTVLAWLFGTGAVVFAPVGGSALVREAPGWSPGTLALVGFVVLVPTLLAYGVNAWALRRASPGLVTIYIYLQPLAVALLAWLQLGQAPEPRTGLAGILILGGVALVVIAPRQSVATTDGLPRPAKD